MAKPFISRCIYVIKQQGLLGFFRKINARHFDPFKIIFYPWAALKVPNDKKGSFTAESTIDYVFTKFGRFLKPYQFKTEILNLAKIIENQKPKTVLEIGTSTGGTLFTWARLASQEAHIVSVDLPGGENNWAYPSWKEGFYGKFGLASQKIDLIRGDSQSKETFSKVKAVFGNAPVDFLFIDADHSYNGVKKDYELYSQLVKQGGIIAFHDIVQSPEETTVGVKTFWNEIKQGKEFQEFVENQDQGWGGIGVLTV